MCLFDFNVFYYLVFSVCFFTFYRPVAFLTFQMSACIFVFLLYCFLGCIECYFYYFYYAALLPRRGPHIASHSVCPSVRLSVCLSVCPSVCPSVPLSLPSVTSRHLANYNDTRGPHIVRPSRPHKFLFLLLLSIFIIYFFFSSLIWTTGLIQIND